MTTLGRDTIITWLGHGTVHIRTPGGKRLLVDGWVDSNPACPDEWKRRVREEGISMGPSVARAFPPRSKKGSRWDRPSREPSPRVRGEGGQRPDEGSRVTR